MINHFRSYYDVHKPAFGVALLVVVLLVVGVGGGYAISKMVERERIKDITQSHIEEISRIQTSNQQVIIYLTTRMQELIERQGELANEVAQSAMAARRHANSAKQSSANAAKSTIRIREIPPVPVVKNKHKFPERIEH